MSKSGSSTHTGWPQRNGTSTRRRAKTGARGSLSAMSSFIRANEYPPGTVAGSTTDVMTTCIWRFGLSRYKKLASRPLRRSMGIRSLGAPAGRETGRPACDLLARWPDGVLWCDVLGIFHCQHCRSSTHGQCLLPDPSGAIERDQFRLGMDPG